MVKTICVAGAGTMGSSIALIAAQSGFSTLLFDVNRIALERSLYNVQHNIRHLVDKQKIAKVEAESIFKRIQFIYEPGKCVADLFIEAIIENAYAKIELFNKFASINAGSAIFASNTSSLSISSLQAEIQHPERICGMHFFNPATVMKLVEVIKGKQTAGSTIQIIDELCKSMGKIAVHCKDTPGFIVNRVARHYYLETLKMLESGHVSVENADRLMESLGFKMGPFKLMDLIGLDINLAVSKSIYDSFNKKQRFTPSALQEKKVINGELGRKTGKGFYTYID